MWGGPGKIMQKLKKMALGKLRQKKEFPADQVAALVVDMDYKPASPVSDI